MRNEARSVLDRYSRRSRVYDPRDPSVYMPRQELERGLIRWLSKSDLGDTRELSLLEIGCGTGANLQQLLRLGFRAENLVGNELQQSRAEQARNNLPAAVTIDQGDALDFVAEAGSFNVVFQSLVFSSILDDSTQAEIAKRMWDLASSSGGILWYDFMYDNPKNPDVRGVSRSRIRELFPSGRIQFWRLTLAPPISRAVTRLSSTCYPVFNFFPFLRTHCLCWIQKQA